jgi:glycosyltransferase involved in cell wall biosynthesis
MKEDKFTTLWIAWETHRRTLELYKTFNAQLHIFDSASSRFLKHPRFLLSSWKIIHSKKPEILIVQNPSGLLALFAVLIRNIYRFKLIVDAHNSGILPANRLLAALGIMLRYIQRKADLTLVTNEGLAEIVKKNGGNPFVLPDRIPQKSRLNKKSLPAAPAVLCVCTFGSDEPYTELIRAASIADTVSFYITGRFRKIYKKLPRPIPPNLVFTGFLAEEEYWTMLNSVNFVLDLTTRENCLVCGAYEAIAAKTPLILSDTRALRSYFHKGVIFTLNDADSIARAVKEALRKEQELRNKIEELQDELALSWLLQAEKLLEYLNQDFRHPCRRSKN